MQQSSSTLLVLLLLSGCQSAFLTFPGGELKGEEFQVSTFSFASGFELLQLEVRPERPYSVWLRVVMHGDQLYVDAANNRRWHQYLKDNARVRIKLGDNIYPANAVKITDADLANEFIKGRTIFRLDPDTVSR